MLRRCRPRRENAATERGRLIQPSRQASGVGRCRFQSRRNKPFLLHAAEGHVNRSALQPTTGGGDELQSVHGVVVGDQQLEDQGFDSREARRVRKATSHARSLQVVRLIVKGPPKGGHYIERTLHLYAGERRDESCSHTKLATLFSVSERCATLST